MCRSAAPADELPAFWHAAAAISGRFDPRSVAEALGGDDQLAHASTAALTQAGVPLRLAHRLRQGRPLPGAGPALTWADPRYPARLREVAFAPPVLFYLGNLDLLDAPAVVIVGARACTATGRRMTALLSQAVVAAGGVVVSGLAHGIDEVAHRAAEGRTIAVLGQGLGRPLPMGRRRLLDEILEQGGLVLTEFLPDTPPARWTYPQRNRIVAGLGQVTAVVEAGRRSGSLITARHALELGRDVLAVPGHPTLPASAGCLDLIEQGATMLRSASQLVEAMGSAVPERGEAPDNPDGRDILIAMGDGATIDEIVARTGRSPIALVRALTALELTGLVERLPGERYAPARSRP